MRHWAPAFAGATESPTRRALLVVHVQCHAVARDGVLFQVADGDLEERHELTGTISTISGGNDA